MVGRASLRANLADEQELQNWLSFPRGIPPRFAGRWLAGTLGLPFTDIPLETWRNRVQGILEERLFTSHVKLNVQFLSLNADYLYGTSR
jgi:hypothetical protein